MSDTILQCTGSPTSTGTMWLTDGITGSPAFASRIFSAWARSWWRMRTSLWARSQRIEASTPALSAGALASIRWLKAHNELRVRHQERAQALKARFAAAGLPVMPSVSHIVPVMVGDPVHCKLVSDMLLVDHGVYVQPINYPTVPRGTERLRFTPTPFHTDQMMDDLTGALSSLWSKCNIARLGGVAA